MRPNELGYARLGIIVSKKIERHAVKRNWIKRILRETFRRNRLNDQKNEKDWIIRLHRSVARNESIKLATETRLLMLQLQQCHD